MDKIKRTYYRAVFISDVHLGYKDCKAQYLLDFLNSIKCERLYLVGDIVDLWSMKRRFFWHPSHYHVLEALKAKADEGTRVIYVPGNHDETFRRYDQDTLMGVEVHRQFVHTTQDDKRFLILHGDDFDSATRYNRLIRVAGDAAYDFLLFLNRWHNRIRRLYGGRYWSLASWIKARLHKAQAAITAFENAAIHEAKRQGYDGIVCGHIHQPQLRISDGIIYCNDGDWIENCTALVENEHGRMELLHWSDTQHVVASNTLAEVNSKAA
ncbi:UDP-2,3-diacylglucosamine diphosphatase [Pseudoalteromonas sp. T1lg48]|uniref:UDP-2,3-diacylglucosamine diphosphatase n=1 Tax=Pseudoalteromonas sp. T1lg48 TaxID=2077100 RepID=UPI001F305620|nr:UDP-2,3-diacylglucosamine diphosphatase [Pseudoalteromonas sp. T1lg48]